MKKNTLIPKIFLFLMLLLGVVGASGQECYKQLTDISGIEYEVSNIEEAACELIDSLPSEFQNDFKVYDGGFYIHLESYRGYGYPEAFEDLKDEITTTYYLIVGRQNDSRGLNTKFFVEVNLPDITSDGCMPDLNDKASKLVEYVLTESYKESGSSPASYPASFVKAIKALQNYISIAKDCCQNGGNVDQCIECNNPDNIAANLLSLGFVEEDIKNIGSFSGSANLPPEIIDYANLLFTVNDLTVVDIPSSYIEQIPIYQARGLSIKIYITKDENVCTSVWQSVIDEIENNPADVIFWHHIHNGNPNQLGDEKLFTRVYVKGEGSSMINEGRRPNVNIRGPDPLTSIIGALGAAFSDAMIQTVSIYFLSDDIEAGDWGEAFSRINFGSVAWSGFTGLFVVNKRMVTVALAVGAATAEVTYNAYYNPDYTLEQGAVDFGRVFISEIIGASVGKVIGNKLKNVNLSWFSHKALTKLRNIIVDQNSTTSKRLFIKIGKNFENSGLTHKFDDWLWDDIFHQGGETPWEHIVARHTALNAPQGKSFFNPKFDFHLDKLKAMINEAAHDWANFSIGEGTLIDFIENEYNGNINILLDFSSKKSKFGLSADEFIGKATDGEWINTIRVTITKDVKIYNAFPSKTVE